jgi:ubiquitin C-terminal hydrolase
MLDILHESTAQEVEMRILRPPPQTLADEHCIKALTAWKQQFSKTYSPFVDLFYGLYHYVVTCKGCGKESHRWEPFNSLKVPIPSDSAAGEPFDLIDALNKQLSEEEVIEEYVCEKCGPPRKIAKKTMAVWKMPSVLVLNLKRFGNDGRKNQKPLKPISQFPIELSAVYSDESPERNTGIHYTVRGVVDHHGNHLAGHYTAQCKNPSSNQWAVFDDESVTDVAAPAFGASTYMVFMERR